MRPLPGKAMVLFAASLSMVLAGAAIPPGPATVPSGQPARELTLDLNDKVTLTAVLIPAGEFLMGSSQAEKDRKAVELQHEVAICKPFAMGITHVTVEQFAAFVKDAGYQTDAERTGNAIGFQHARTAA